MERRSGTESTTDSHDLMDLDSQNDSTDLMNMTTQTEASPGPALVSNSSNDSDFLTRTSAGAHRDGGDVASGPSIHEAEAFAEQMTRELLDNSDSTVRRSSHGDDLGEANVMSTAQEVVNSAIVEATQTISLQQDEKTDTQKVDKESSPNFESAPQAAEGNDEHKVVAGIETAAPGEQDSTTKESALCEAAQQPAVFEHSKPLVKEKKLSVNIGPVTYQYSADSLDESQMDPLNKDDGQSQGTTVVGHKDDEKRSQKMDLDQQTAAPEEIAPEEEDKENLAEPVVKREQDHERLHTLQQQDELHHSRPADDSWAKQLDLSTNEPLHQTFKTAFNASHNDQEHNQEPFEDNNNKADTMEFTKNYSDDLLMGAGEQQRNTNNNDSADLADFELPPYNGSSSSGSEQAATTYNKQQQSPAKQRRPSNTATQASSTSANSGSDLTAVKNILISSYSKGAHIFHWKKPIESGIIFAIGLVLIAALTFFSIISVVAYSALGIVLASGLIRIYKTSMRALNRSTETPVDHIWEKVLGLNVSMSPERMHKLIDSSHANLNASLVYFKQVLLVEDKVATLKFFLFLYALTYIGAWFNGLTLITIIYVSVFSVPIIYEKNKTNIDQYLNLATDQISSAISLVTGRVTALIGGPSSSAKKQN